MVARQGHSHNGPPQATDGSMELWEISKTAPTKPSWGKRKHDELKSPGKPQKSLHHAEKASFAVACLSLNGVMLNGHFIQNGEGHPETGGGPNVVLWVWCDCLLPISNKFKTRPYPKHITNTCVTTPSPIQTSKKNTKKPSISSPFYNVYNMSSHILTFSLSPKERPPS